MTRFLAAIGIFVILLGTATPAVAASGGCRPAGHGGAGHVGRGSNGRGSGY